MVKDDLIKYIGTGRINKDYLDSLGVLVFLTKKVLAGYIPWMEPREAYDLDDYIIFDKWLSENPCVFSEDEDVYDSLKELVPGIINAYGFDFEFDCFTDDIRLCAAFSGSGVFDPMDVEDEDEYAEDDHDEPEREEQGADDALKH